MKFDVFSQLQPFYDGVATALSTKHVLFPGLLFSLRMNTRGHLQEDAQRSAKPMSPNTFNLLFNQLLVSASAYRVTLCFKSLKRFMPSLGQAVEIHEEDAQATGNWHDVPQGTVQSGISRGRAVFLMGKHYASGTARYPVEIVKTRLLQELFMILAQIKPQLVTENCFFKTDSLTWDKFHAAHIKRSLRGNPTPLEKRAESSSSPSSSSTSSSSFSSRSAATSEHERPPSSSDRLAGYLRLRSAIKKLHNQFSSAAGYEVLRYQEQRESREWVGREVVC